MLEKGKTMEALVLENRKVKFNQSEELEQWVNNAVVSLSASLVFGRDKASQIAQPLLVALFTLTSNDFKKALEIIVHINDFSVKRIFLEQFKYCYIVNTGSEDLSVLALSVDFSNKQMSDEYDAILLKLFNENNKDSTLLSENLGVLPIKAKRVALKRLHSNEFARFKKVKVRPIGHVESQGKPMVKIWHWILIVSGLVAVAVTQIE